MPRTAANSESEGQGQRKLSLLFAVLGGKLLRLTAALFLLVASLSANAIPPNTPITNTAVVDYMVSGVLFSGADSETVVTDPGAGNSPPYAIAVAPSVIDENEVAGSVGIIDVSDLDPLDTHTFIVSDARFEVQGTTLRLVAGESLDFETAAQIPLTITASDPQGAQFVQIVNVTVNDLNEAPSDVTLSSQTVIANQLGAVVGLVTVVDPDAGDTHVTTVDDPRFEVVAGELKLLDTQTLPVGITTITLTTTDAGGLVYIETFDITAGSGSAGNSAIGFLQIGQGIGDSVAYGVEVAQCNDGTGWQDLPSVQSAFGQVVSIPATLELRRIDHFVAGDAAFLLVLDADANLDVTVRDRVSVRLETDDGDVEEIALAETGNDTGEFVGYVQTASGAALADDCILQGDVNATVTATYIDSNDATDSSSAQVLIDPFGLIFDSATGRPINGAVVTIIDQSTGQPASVFDDDGVSSFPATVVSGDTTYAFDSGSYRFPFANSGDYALQVVAPNRFSFPSQVGDGLLQGLPGAPFALSAASRGMTFNLPVGPALRIDIPLDQQPIVPSDSALQLLVVTEAGAGPQSVYMNAGTCFDGTSFVAQDLPASLAQGPLALPQDVDVSAADRFTRGDAVVIEVTDPDQDRDPFAPDQVEVAIEVAGQSDRERITLMETNDSTGVFVGYVQTSSQSPVGNNCSIEATQGSELVATYIDAGDATDSAGSSALLDPGYTAFSSASGDPLDGVEVTLVDAATGQPAEVFSSDGVTSFPATLTSGGTATDGDGQTFDFATGSFFYPTIPSGTYRFEVVAPTSYNFPSEVDDQTLDQLPAGPFILTSGSRGQEFTVSVTTPSVFDVPLDPISAELFVSKRASRDTAAIGDFVQYQVAVQNGDEAGTVSSLRLVDQIPVGFRYMSGSLSVDRVTAGEPLVANNGRDLAIDLPDLGPGDALEIRYVLEVTAGVRLGPARNTATVIGTGVGSANTAFADVLVTEDLFTSTSIIVGQIYDGGCGAQDGAGLDGVRVWLEDGSFVVSDANGKFHFEGIEPGTHVLQLDNATLPTSHEVIACERDTRFAGASHSQFVDLQAGMTWRADFYVNKKPNAESEVVGRLDAEAEEGYIHYELLVKGGEIPLSKLRATLVLDEQLAYVQGTSRIGGQPIDDPKGFDQGALVFRLPDNDGSFDYRVEFDAFVKDPRGLIETKSMLMFESASGSHRSDVVTNELSTKWPSSLIVIGESAQGATRPVLTQARQVNAARISGTTASTNAKPARGFSVSSEVHEPSRGSNRSRSNLSTTLVSVEPITGTNEPYELPSLDRGEDPTFNVAWLESHHESLGIAWPPENYNPTIPAIPVAVVHAKGLNAQLLVDGKLVNPLTFEGTTTHHELQVSVTHWDNVTISERGSVIEARLLDRDGVTIKGYERPVHFSGGPAKAEIVEAESYLVADGLYPPMLAVRFYDRAGFPLRAGTTGEFSIEAPYEALNQTKHLESVNNEMNNERFHVVADGIAYLQLEPTTATGEVEVRFQFDQVRQEVVRARLKPGARDWIMVGLVEGSYSHMDIEGDQRTVHERDLDATEFDGRVAFYSKGMVRGDWLLTASYDTDKAFERKLREQIDPNQFYSLYGDGTQQLYDAESQRKLYLKIEKDRFSGLFGDFDVSFNRSELTRYERRMNGLDLGYFGDRIEVNAFASQTDQAFVRDEFRGDGTSGVYRLSRKRLVVNSDQLRVVTRDRFSTDVVLEEQTLTRFLDYTIDYAAGTVIFKQPIFSQDENFNPIFIEVEYEVAGAGADEDIVAGARVAYRLDERDSEVSVTYVNDSTQGQSGDLLGADLTWQMTDSEQLIVEVASSELEQVGSGNAYLAQLEHSSEKLAGRAYIRKQDEQFGLGHQSSLERGTFRYGIDGEYQVNREFILHAEAFRQELLETGAKRAVLRFEGEYNLGETRLAAGVQAVRQDSPAAESADTNQITMGVSRAFMRNRLVLKGDAEIDVGSTGGNTDYPSRVILGAEYGLLADLDLILEQEFSWGDERDTQDMRFGVRSRPWAGADISSILSRQQGENGERLFATTGLLQQWRMNERWLFDVGFDRVNTVSQDGELPETGYASFGPSVPTTSGSFNEDFSAFFTGAGYRHENWDASMRLEYHSGDQADKWNWLAGANHQLADGKVMSASLSVLNEEAATGAVQDAADLRFGVAWRPNASRWTFLNRMDLVFDERRDGLFDTQSRKWVDNFNANFKARGPHQVSLQLGLKYNVENIDNQQFSSLTALYGVEYRFDINEKWDIGVKGSILDSGSANVREYSYGLSVGYSLFENTWVSLGYNFAGFSDDDFIAARYTADGPYVKLRMKFDQDVARRFLEFAGIGESRQMQSTGNSR